MWAWLWFITIIMSSPSLSLSFSWTSFLFSFIFIHLSFPPPLSLSLSLILYPTLPLFNSSTALQLLVAMMEAMAPAPSLTRLTHGHNVRTQNAGPTTIMMSVIRSVTMLPAFMMGETARFYYPLVLQSKCVINTVLSDVKYYYFIYVSFFFFIGTVHIVLVWLVMECVIWTVILSSVHLILRIVLDKSMWVYSTFNGVIYSLFSPSLPPSLSLPPSPPLSSPLAPRYTGHVPVLSPWCLIQPHYNGAFPSVTQHSHPLSRWDYWVWDGLKRRSCPVHQWYKD